MLHYIFKVRSLDEEQNWPYLCLIFCASSVLYWICNKKRVTPWECVSAEEFNHTIHVLVKDTLSGLSEATCHGEGPPVCSQTCEITLKSQGRSLPSRQWGNKGIQWLPFLLNTSWSKQPFSGKWFEAVSLYLLLQGKNHEEARKNCSSLALSAFSSIALTKVVHSPITVITSQRQKCPSPAFQGWVCSSGIRKISIQQSNFLKTVFEPFSYGKKRQLKDEWEDTFNFFAGFSEKEWEKRNDRCLFLCPLTLYAKGMSCFCFRNLRVYCCVEHMR